MDYAQPTLLHAQIDRVCAQATAIQLPSGNHAMLRGCDRHDSPFHFRTRRSTLAPFVHVPVIVRQLSKSPCLAGRLVGSRRREPSSVHASARAPERWTFHGAWHRQLATRLQRASVVDVSRSPEQRAAHVRAGATNVASALGRIHGRMTPTDPHPPARQNDSATRENPLVSPAASSLPLGAFFGAP
jgi:hypothetical protein